MDRLVLNALVNGSAALPPDNCGPVRVKRVASLSETAVSDRLRRATAVREERVICRTRPHTRRNFQIFSLACVASA